MGLGIMAGLGKVLAPATVKAAGATAGALQGTAAGGIMQAMLPAVAAKAGGAAVMSAGLTLAGGGLSALQQYGQASYAAKMAELKAGDARVAAKQALNDARGRALAIDQEANRHLGHVLNMQAYRGQLGMETAQADYDAQAESASFNSDMERLSGRITSSQHRMRQSLYEGQADYYRSQGKYGVMGTLFRTGLSLAGSPIADAITSRKKKKPSESDSSLDLSLLDGFDRQYASYF